MRILMTGHDGYIGAVMTPMLQAEGHEIVGLDTGYFEGCNFGAYEAPVSLINKDIRNIEISDLDGIDAVIHLAAISNDPLGNLNPGGTYHINHEASVHLAKLAREAGCSRYVYSSSCSVYGAASPDDVLDETASFSPVTPYAESKVMVERDVSALATDEFSPVYMRNATVYGVSPKLRGDLVVNNLVGWAVTTGQVLIKSDGTPWRPLVHVEDVCHAFSVVLTAPRESIHNQAFNVGLEGENYRVRSVAEIVNEAVEGSELIFADGAEGDPRCYRVDFSKIKACLPEFKPSWTVRRGVEELRDAFLKIGLTQHDLEGDRYLRIKTIMRLMEEGKIDSDLRWLP